MEPRVVVIEFAVVLILRGLNYFIQMITRVSVLIDVVFIMLNREKVLLADFWKSLWRTKILDNIFTFLVNYFRDILMVVFNEV